MAEKTFRMSWIEPVNFGPFAVPARLDLDSRVTVLTGPNDVGKSSLLMAINYSLSDKKADESQVNQNRRDTFSGKATDDPEVVCHFGLVVTDEAMVNGVVGGGTVAGDEVVCVRRLNAAGGIGVKHVVRGTKQHSIGLSITKPPQVIHVQPGEVRNLLPLGSLTEDEVKLLRLGFGLAFPQNVEGSQANWRLRVRRAESELNRRLKEVLPASMGLEFTLSDTAGTAKELELGLLDPINTLVPVSSRGAGVRKLLSLMGTLLSLSDLSRPTLVLIDEPENSLHADAQHSLRRLLERLAESPLIQVVYATHSPSMINSMRPEAVRVLERTTEGDKPTTMIHNRVYHDSFLHVRSSLGITPADSLLYAQVTVVVEGETEVLCLGKVLEKLADAGVPGFVDVRDILPEICLVDGMGGNFAYVCRLAKLQKANPMVFLDGDMEGDKSVVKLKKEHPDVSVLFISGRREFEQVVSPEVYINAVAKELESDPAVVNRAEFERWTDQRKEIKKLAFSKQVEAWIANVQGEKMHKQQIMSRAIDDAEAKDIDAEPFRALLDEVRKTLGVTANASR